MRQKIRGIFSVLIGFTIVFSMCAVKLDAATTVSTNQTGIHDGYDYELWKDYGNASMTMKDDGAFSCEWDDDINNVLFLKGKRYKDNVTYKEIGNITIDYDCDFEPNGNSYLGVYGWSNDPLVEYYIIDSWGTWKPPGSTSKGEIDVDDGTYEIYEVTRVNAPAINGFATFNQYWSVRTTKRTKGTISVSEHFKAWESLGMMMGNMYEVMFLIEGYQSSGKADVTYMSLNTSIFTSAPKTPTNTPTKTPSPSGTQGIITANQIGIHDGYDYELWKDNGNTSMTLKDGGAFSCEWDDINNVLFLKGKKYENNVTYQEIGNISIDYDCDFEPNGNSYLGAYGWTKDPLVEYYIIESWGTWKPPGSTSKGSIDIDDGTYEIYDVIRYNYPSINGPATFKQYWSVRTTKRTKGTISVSEHFKAWESLGMMMGNMYEVMFLIEGYQSSGKADVTYMSLNTSIFTSAPKTPTNTPTKTPSPSGTQGIITANQIGIHDGYDYELWKDNGNTSMTLKDGGAFSCEWEDNINNVLFLKGKRYENNVTYQEIGDITIDYDCDFEPNGNSYLGVYGWTIDPRVEYYIIDSWGTWKPPGETSKGKIDVDGGSYEIYEVTKYGYPSINGPENFKQYWSVRTTKRTKGTISVSEHFKAWENLGMSMGKIYEVKFLVEGYQSSGKADVKYMSLNIIDDPEDEDIVVKGDIDDNGSFNSIDFGYLRAYLLGSKTLTQTQIKAADVDINGEVNSIDFATMRLVLLGIKTDF